MRRAIMTVALTGCLVAGAAAASILMRDSVPMAGAAIPSGVIQGAVHPISNWESKQDRLAVRLSDSASLDLTTGTVSPEARPESSAVHETVDPSPDRQAPTLTRSAKANPIKAETASAAPAAVKPASVKPVSQKPEPLLSDGQIAGIKERLKLSSDQEYYWPAVENALRAVGRKINAGRSPNAVAGAPLIDPDAAEVQQLKFAAMPLLFQLREDQKREVRSLARLMGLEQVAAQI